MKDLEALGFVEDVPMTEAPQSPQEMGAGEAALRGGAQGITLGFADELGGGIDALGAKLTGSETPLLDLYTQHRDGYRKELERAKAAHPYITGGAQFVGSLPTVFATGGTGIGAAAVGAGVMAAGDSSADLTKGEFGQFAGDVGKGAVIGAGTAGLAQAAAPYVQRIANTQAVRSLGPKIKHLKKMIGTDKIDEMGQMLHDENVIKPFQSAEGAFESLAGKTDEIGQEIEQGFASAPRDPIIDPRAIANSVKQEAGQALRYVPEGGKTMGRLSNYLDDELAMMGNEIPEVAVPGRPTTITRKSEFIPEPVVQPQPDYEGGIVQVGSQHYDLPNNPNERFMQVPGAMGPVERQGIPYPSGLNSFNRPVNRFDHPEFPPASGGFATDPTTGLPIKQIVEKRIEGIPDQMRRGMGVEEAWNLRKGIDSAIDYQKRTPDMPGFMQGLVSTRNELQSQILQNAPEGMAQNMGRYHVLETAENIAKDAATRNAANRAVSPSDYVAGLGGLVKGHGDPVTGAAFGIANHVVRTRGNSTTAWTLNKLAKALKANPKMFGVYAGPLTSAASRGENGLATAHFLMSQQDPGYRQTLDGLEFQEEGQ